MTSQFIEFLKNYISYCFKNDIDFANIDFTIDEAYDYNQELSCPQIAIQLLTNSENERYSSFEAENVSDFGIQFNVFSENLEINGKIYDAKNSSSFISDRLKIFMNDLKFKRFNTNIVRLVRNGIDFRTPIDNTGQVYANIIRYECQIIYPYNVNLENYIKEI